MEDFVIKMSDVFKALGDPNRMKIIWMLSSETINELSVMGISEELGITQSAASQHLKILRQTGLLKPIKKGFYKYYQIDKTVFENYKIEINKLFDLAVLKKSEICNK